MYEEQVSIIFGKNYVLTLSEGRNDAFDILKQRISSNEERLRVAGPDYLAYAIIDVIVDQYFLSLEKLGERIEKIEDEVVTSATPTALEEIHDLKTELVFIRESTWPLREVLDRIAEVKTPLIKESTRPYFRDVYDHTVHAIDIIETFRDIVSGILDIYLSSVSLKLNEVMKVLTVIGTIFLPLAFIASVYGMNFRQPEVASELGLSCLLASDRGNRYRDASLLPTQAVDTATEREPAVRIVNRIRNVREIAQTPLRAI